MTVSSLPIPTVERPCLAVHVCHTTGHPCATVPSAWLWDLVEYLSYGRVAASYRRQTESFLVDFEHSSAETAQQILNDWIHLAPELRPTQ